MEWPQPGTLFLDGMAVTAGVYAAKALVSFFVDAILDWMEKLG